MAQKKETNETTTKKTDVKVQDLAPKKDAKGGMYVPKSTNTGGKLGTNAPRGAN